MPLNPEQQRAVDASASSVVVCAVPGAGKTTVLVERVIRHLRAGVDPQRLVVLAFTRAAVKEISDRIAAAGVVPPIVATYHGYCARVVLPRSGAVLYPPHVGDAVYRLAHRQINGAMGAVPSRRVGLRNGLVRDQFHAHMDSAGAVEYHDLHRRAAGWLAKRQKSGQGQVVLHEVLVDEAQDLTAGEWAMIRSLPSAGWFFVGDQEQSIFGFAGAHPASFEEQKATSLCLGLGQSYRLPDAVVAFLRERAPDVVIQPAPGRVGNVYSCEGTLDELVSALAMMQEDDIRPMAVLAHRWVDLKRLALGLQQRKLSYQLEADDIDPWASPDGQALELALTAAIYAADPVLPLLVFEADLRGPGGDAKMAAIQAMRSRAISTLDAVASVVGGAAASFAELVRELHDAEPPTPRSWITRTVETLGLGFDPEWAIAHVETMGGEGPLVSAEPSVSWPGRWLLHHNDALALPATSVDADIVLTTVFKAKGREWADVVVLNAQKWPETPEGHRMRFVAFTRTMNNLWLFEEKTS